MIYLDHQYGNKSNPNANKKPAAFVKFLKPISKNISRMKTKMFHPMNARIIPPAISNISIPPILYKSTSMTGIKAMKLLTTILALGFLSAPCFAAIGGSPGGISINFVENAGSTVTQRNVINFQGTGVSVMDNNVSSRTDVTISGGSGGSSLAVSKDGVIVSSPTKVINFVGPGAAVTLTGGATAQITINAGDAFLASTQTWSGQNLWKSMGQSTFTYGVTIGSITLLNQASGRVLYLNGNLITSTSTFLFNGTTETVQALITSKVSVSTLQITSQLLDYSGNPGPIGYVFTSNGSGLPPSWQVSQSTSGTPTITSIVGGTGITVTNSSGPIVTISATGGGGSSYYYQLLDVSTAGVSVNYQPCYDGTTWVVIPIGGACSFSVASFSDSLSAIQEIGTGVWKSSGTISFTASYSNGPPTSSTVTYSGWATPLSMVSPFTSTTSIASVNYPAVAGSVVFTLSSKKGASSASSSITHSFYNYRFWGTTTVASGYTEAEVEALSGSELSNSQSKTFSVTASAGQYIVYAYPSRLGTATFTVGGFSGGFKSPETVSITNSAGYTENYYVYSTVNSGLGSTTVVVTP